MITKTFLMPLFLGTLTLAGCGNNGQQTPVGAPNAATATNASAAPEVITVIAEDQVHSLAPDVLGSAKLTGAACSLDTVDGAYFKDQVKLIGGKPHVFRGWVLDNTKHPAGRFSLVLKGAQDFAIPATTGTSRRDVSDFFNDPSLTSAGFNISSKLSLVPAGEYSVIFIVQREQYTYYCDAKKNLTMQ